MKYTYPFTAIFSNGYTVVVNDQIELKDLVKQHGWFGYEWLETEYTRSFRYRPYTETLPRDYEPKYFTLKRFEWIVRDDFGLKVDPAKIDFNESGYYPWWYRGKRMEQRNAAEKGLPIPYLRRSYRRKKKYKKHGGKHVAAKHQELAKEFNRNKRWE